MQEVTLIYSQEFLTEIIINGKRYIAGSETQNTGLESLVRVYWNEDNLVE